METTTTKEKPAAPAKPLSPAELAEELVCLAEEAIPWALRDEVTRAAQALAAVQAKMNRAGERKLRILRAKSLEEADAILTENPGDENLKKLCQRVTGWKPLIEGGATDAQIKAQLSKESGGWGASRKYPYEVPSAHHGHGSPEAWVDPDRPAGGPSHLSGQKLVDAVRRVMGIPQPAKPAPAAKKAAPAKKGTKPKAAAAAPAMHLASAEAMDGPQTSTDAGDDEDAA